MYYNRILRIWAIDPLDYFLLSAIIGSIAALRLKDYLSEKEAMERLKNSIIKKSKLAAKSELVIESNRSVFNSKKIRIKKVYKFALENRGGQFENFPEDYEFSNEVFKLAQEIKKLVERLAVFLKERELKGVAKIFFKNGILLLELLLCKCKIDITYSLLTEGLSTQVIVITSTVGGAAGFTFSWVTAGASLVSVPALISIFSLRSIFQQIMNQRDYVKFKWLVNKMLEDDELKQSIRAFFIDGEVPATSSIEMKSWDSDKNSLPEFNIDSDQTFEEFIKARIKEEFRLEDPNDIIDAEIVKEAIRVKVKDKEL